MTTLRGDRVGILGAGAVGTALAVGLSEAGYNVTAITSRNTERARMLAGLIGGAIHTRHAGLLVDVADIVFLTVPDDVIGSVAESVPWRSGMAAVHCSGGTPVSVLECASGYGAVIGGFHPLYTFPPSATRPVTLENVTFAIESQDPALHHELRDMAHALHGHAIDINEKTRALYHISGCARLQLFGRDYCRSCWPLGAIRVQSVASLAGAAAAGSWNGGEYRTRWSGRRADRSDSPGRPRHRAGAPGAVAGNLAERSTLIRGARASDGKVCR